MAEEHKVEKQFHERKRSLTDEDIAQILVAFENRPTHLHACRFEGVSEEDFYESVKFFKYLNEVLTSGRNIVAKTILVLLVTFLFGLLGAGIISKVK